MQNSRVNTCAGVFFGKVKGSLKLYCITKRLHYRCFPLNLVKFLSAHILRIVVMKEIGETRLKHILHF